MRAPHASPPLLQALFPGGPRARSNLPNPQPSRIPAFVFIISGLNGAVAGGRGEGYFMGQPGIPPASPRNPTESKVCFQLPGSSGLGGWE